MIRPQDRLNLQKPPCKVLYHEGAEEGDQGNGGGGMATSRNGQSSLSPGLGE